MSGKETQVLNKTQVVSIERPKASSKAKKFALKVVAMTIIVFMLFSTTGVVVLAQTYVNYRERVALQENFRENQLSVYRAAVFLDQYTTVLFSNNVQFTITEYPESYGGSFIDENNILHITYVGSRRDLTRGKRYYENIVFSSVLFSYNQLENILDVLSGNMAYLYMNVASLNEFDNRIDISTNGCQEAIIDFLYSEIPDFNREAIYFSEVVRPETTSVVQRGGTRVSRDRAGVEYFTVGYNAFGTNGTVGGFVTAGHSFLWARDTPVYRNGVQIGRVVNRQFEGRIDAAFVAYVPLRNTATAELNSAGNWVDVVRSTMPASSIRAGMQVSKYGARTFWQTGEITRVSSTLHTNYGVFTQQVEINILQMRGDSGAALVQGYMGPHPNAIWPVSLIGIVTFADGNTWRTAWASTAENINAAFGLRTTIRII